MRDAPAARSHTTARSPWVTLAGTALGVAVYAVVAVPLLSSVALDFEALVSNLILDWDWSEAAPPLFGPKHAWIPPGQYLVKFGPAPLFCLLVVASLHRVLRVPLPVWLDTRRTRALVSLGVIVPFLAACVPIGQAAAIWSMVELSAFVQWYGDMEEVTRALLPTPWVWSATVAHLGLSLLYLAWAPRPRTGARGWARALRWGWRLSLVPVAAVLVLGGPVLLLHAARVAPVSGEGRKLFEQRCGGCHERALSLYYIKTPAEWERTMATQVEVEGVSLTSEERRQVTSFLLGMRSFSDAWVFRTRCQRCHLLDHRRWEARDPADWQRITERIAVGSPYYYRNDIRDQIVDHLEGRRLRDPTTTDEEREQVTLTARCATCHTVSYRAERFRGAKGEALEALVDRMNDKSAHPLAPDEISAVARAYGDLISDAERLRELLPHDTPPGMEERP